MSDHSTEDLLNGLMAAHVSANVIGNFGSGKSSIIRTIGEKAGKKVILKSLNKMDTTDFSGIPYLSEEMGVEYDREGNVVLDPITKEPKKVRVVKNSPSPFIKELLENPNSILFMDEINRAPAALQSAALTLIQDGDAGDTKIAKSVWRVSAMNASDVGVNAFSMAAANRFCHIWHEADVESFKVGFITGFKESHEPKVNTEEEVIKNRLKYRTAVVDFIGENPALLSKVPEDGSDELAFPTPRTWEMATEVLTYLDKNDHDYLITLVCGCVGKDAGKLFMKYVEGHIHETVDLTEWLGKEDKFTLPNPDRPDEVFHILQSLEYWFDIDPVKWYPMWRRILKLLHNDQKKYGKYANYDNFIMIYWQKNFPVIISRCMKDAAKEIADLRIEMEGCFEVMTINTCR